MPTVLYREQKLSNYIQEKKLLKAIGLAISLGQPFRVLTIMKGKVTLTDNVIFILPV